MKLGVGKRKVGGRQAMRAARGTRDLQGGPCGSGAHHSSRTATGVARPQTKHGPLSTRRKKRVLPAISFYFPPAAFFLLFHSSLPHPSALALLAQLSSDHCSLSPALCPTRPALKLHAPELSKLPSAFRLPSPLEDPNPLVFLSSTFLERDSRVRRLKARQTGL